MIVTLPSDWHTFIASSDGLAGFRLACRRRPCALLLSIQRFQLQGRGDIPRDMVDILFKRFTLKGFTRLRKVFNTFRRYENRSVFQLLFGVDIKLRWKTVFEIEVLKTGEF